MEIVKGNLYKSTTTSLVVMADEQQNRSCFSGQVIIGDGSERVGTFEKSWAISGFEPYSAEIIIKEVIDFSKVQFLEMESGEIVLTDGNHVEKIFYGLNIKKAHWRSFFKSDVKRVVTPNFK
jgi:hypothetical protein